ncbi:non-ribosomal peptide synthetase [Streptomyces sp. TRM76323]|uniref:Non-ribosomal peptide synthetase n=1 Tax=Streptomyces tamarix TaxID=3078565 RepID=A0ABU3QQX7_9ACTN|nr:non-ribosomal peptide synthetase [Streptomyces tamarix]MDT9685016.1 non-ribosomal peptide synthetase [Streptomyces tamarix]
METVWNVVRAQVERTPEAVAARTARTYTYRDVAALAEELGRRIAAEVRPGSLVALDASNQFNGAVAILAAAAAGCAVLPLDRQSPPARRARVLGDARPALLLRELAEGEFALEAHGLPALSREPDLDAIAYILYTSGSTGQPKGVMVGHEALIDRLAGLAERPGLAAGESILAMTALSFDISLAELLLPLTVGASFTVVPEEGRADPLAFAEFVEEARPDLVQATPSFWRMLTASGWTGEPRSRLWTGGEPLTPSLARELLPRCAELWNVYGPTEAVIWATAARVVSADRISIGEPLSGTGMLTDGNGELLLYGTGLAHGYLDREELTAERFPLGDTPDSPRRLYRTGDRVKPGPDGALEFLGRLDSQVKLRGHRIELGEVEAVLEDHPDVSQAVVLVQDADRPDAAALVAFVVQRAETDLQAWLKARLPASHHPARITALPVLPRTSTGKADRVGLAASLAANGDRSATLAAPAAPVPPGDVREAVAEAWRRTLATDTVGEHTNFFDAGGNSVLLAVLQKRLTEGLGIRVPIREIFRNPTVSGLADHIICTKAPK